MAATLDVSCPECQTTIKVPAELAGKKIRCKKCGATFPVKAPAPAKAAAKGAPAKPAKPAAKAPPGKAKPAAPPAKGAPPPAKEDDEFDAPNPYGVTTLDLTPRCPHCAAAMESAESILCLNCGYNTQTREHLGVKKTVGTSPVDKFVWLLPGIVCALVLLAVIGGNLFVWFGMNDYWNEMDGRGTVEEHTYSLGIRTWFVTIPSLIAGFFLGKFAFKRLILHPLPPEAEKH